MLCYGTKFICMILFYLKINPNLYISSPFSLPIHLWYPSQLFEFVSLLYRSESDVCSNGLSVESCGYVFKNISTPLLADTMPFIVDIVISRLCIMLKYLSGSLIIPHRNIVHNAPYVIINWDPISSAPCICYWIVYSSSLYH